VSSKTAVVLLSGGIDSATCLGMAVAQGFDVIAVSFNYGQRHTVELDAAARIAKHYGVTKHYVFELGLFKAIGRSALTADIEVPKGRALSEMTEGIPVTYVPARNLVFLSHAVGVAETHGVNDIFIGVNALDYSGYPDCRPEFIQAFVTMANLATKSGVEGDTNLSVHTPLIELSKADIICHGSSLDVPYHLTHSCYHPTDAGHACAQCDACQLRLEGFREAGFDDPGCYVAVA
jgi:7-cyano-7-deazaguanine synthase